MYDLRMQVFGLVHPVCTRLCEMKVKKRESLKKKNASVIK